MWAIYRLEKIFSRFVSERGFNIQDTLETHATQ